jgi:hypothetical protein
MITEQPRSVVTRFLQRVYNERALDAAGEFVTPDYDPGVSMLCSRPHTGRIVAAFVPNSFTNARRAVNISPMRNDNIYEGAYARKRGTMHTSEATLYLLHRVRAAFEALRIDWLQSVSVVCLMAAACSASNVDDSGQRQSPLRPQNTAGGSPAATTPSVAGAPAGDFGNPTRTGLPAVVTASNIVSGPALGCRGLQCQQHGCASGATTISGRVYDPAGKNPLYNVAVYVPNENVAPIKLGANCDPCANLYTGKPVVSALTDPAGEFIIKNAPDGPNIPLVIQIGKWRKQVTVPNVAACKDTRFPDKTLTLPRNHMEGDIPNIAISTGGADTLECLLHRIGVDSSEYVPGPGEGRIHIFQGSGMGTATIPGVGGPAPNTSPAAPISSAALWNASSELMKYDVLLLSCEGAETMNMNQQALHDYASAGGRVFASHFHYSWFNSGPYSNENLATWTAGANPMNNIGSTIVTSFPKGMALAAWLKNTNALVNGELPIKQARHNADVTAANTVSQPWIVADQFAMPAGATQYFSFNTPTTAGMAADGPGYCGRVVFSDLHVGGATADRADAPVPTGCASVDLSPQEKALEFMLFDLSACIVPDDRPPLPPPTLN